MICYVHGSSAGHSAGRKDIPEHFAKANYPVVVASFFHDDEFCFLKSFDSSCSSGTPLVSGILKITHNNCSVIMHAKKMKSGAAPNFASSIGNICAMTAAN